MELEYDKDSSLIRNANNFYTCVGGMPTSSSTQKMLTF